MQATKTKKTKIGHETGISLSQLCLWFSQTKTYKPKHNLRQGICLFFKVIRMKLKVEEMIVCDYCYEQHNNYMSNIPFDILLKKWVTKCTVCWSAMCQDCVRWSHNEIQDSILAKYDFHICRNCIVTYWRTTDFQNRIEQYVLQQIEEVKNNMKHELYSITKKQWELLTH